MSIEKVLIEFAKVQLQLISANEQIAALQAQIDELTKASATQPSQQQ
jgi:hypothetical protein